MIHMKKVRWNNIVLLIGIVSILWVVASVVDVDIHNDICSPNYGNFSVWNIFNFIF
jgi:hypothetical protein